MKLHLGCGKDIKEGWVNVDYRPISDKVMRVDLTKIWPFNDNSVSEILAKHLIEHIPRGEPLKFFVNEMVRVAKENAIIIIEVPDPRSLRDVWSHPEHQGPIYPETITNLTPEYPETNGKDLKLVSIKRKMFFPKHVEYTFRRK